MSVCLIVHGTNSYTRRTILCYCLKSTEVSLKFSRSRNNDLGKSHPARVFWHKWLAAIVFLRSVYDQCISIINIYSSLFLHNRFITENTIYITRNTQKRRLSNWQIRYILFHTLFFLFWIDFKLSMLVIAQPNFWSMQVMNRDCIGWSGALTSNHVVCFIDLFINEATSVNSGRTAQISGDSKGAPGISSPISFIFMQFSAKILPNNRLSPPPIGALSPMTGKCWIRHYKIEQLFVEWKHYYKN